VGRRAQIMQFSATRENGSSSHSCYLAGRPPKEAGRISEPVVQCKSTMRASSASLCFVLVVMATAIQPAAGTSPTPLPTAFEYVLNPTIAEKDCSSMRRRAGQELTQAECEAWAAANTQDGGIIQNSCRADFMPYCFMSQPSSCSDKFSRVRFGCEDGSMSHNTYWWPASMCGNTKVCKRSLPTASPSAWSAPSGTITTGTSITMTFSGGRGLNLAAGQDASKMVLSSGGCSAAAAAGGTSEVTDLGPDDSTSATSASAAFTWTSAGMYKVCYKLAGGSYAQVGTSAITVTPPAVCSNSTQWDQSRSVCVATLRGIIDACKKERGGWSYTCNSKGDAAIAALPAGEASGPTDPTQRATLCNNATTVYDNNAAQCVASYARSANSCIENVLTSSTSGRIECGTYSNGNK